MAVVAVVGVVVARAGPLFAAESATPDPAAQAAAVAAPATAFDASGQPFDARAAAERLRGARYLLLGEIHDNPLHHRLRADFLRALLADGVPSWVVFEQIDRQHNAAVAASPRDTESVVEAGKLNQPGWAWPLHRPLFDAALAGGATVRGGNLSRAEASAVVRGGVAQAPPELQRFLANPSESGTAAWTAAQDSELRRQVDAGHCGALPAAMIAPMALAQRARDAALAVAMLAAPPDVRVVLIAGNGHVRRDTGVPSALGVSASPSSAVMSIAFLERASDGQALVDGPYDEAWFTERALRPDPCVAFRASRAAAATNPPADAKLQPSTP